VTRFERLEATDPRWIDLISRHPAATVFHHPAWLNVLAECYGYQPMLAALLDDEGRVVAGLPLMRIESWLTGQRLVALPFSDFCPPLAADDDALGELLEALQAWRHAAQLPPIRIHWPLPQAEGVYAAESAMRHTTALEADAAQVFRCFKKTQVQQCIRRAEKLGLRVEQRDRWKDVRLFYDMHVQTRRRLGAPVQPLRFFRLLWAKILQHGLAGRYAAGQRRVPTLEPDADLQV